MATETGTAAKWQFEPWEIGGVVIEGRVLVSYEGQVFEYNAPGTPESVKADYQRLGLLG